MDSFSGCSMKLHIIDILQNSAQEPITAYYSLT